ncbi:MAG: HAMP domain-containing histidine kinase, partial [Flammeovirgaceae bacterium]|nr:HAMP domain-containing histidine kinase [Flammeovirgaceae bacterium]MDW8287214.1 HAMP domain-containing sensor histidine kinase [Flammeovirgaceae bacterium]
QLIDTIEDGAVLSKYHASLESFCQGNSDVFAEKEQLKQEIAKLKQEKEKFFSVVSFWLGSPLNSLKMLSTMLTNDAANMDKTMMLEFIKHLHTQILKLHQLMGNLITWADLEVNNFRFQPANVVLHKLVKDLLLNHQEHATKKGISLQQEIAEDICVVADEEALRKVIDNLLSNAIKFTTKGGKVEISAQKEGQKVKIRVKDTGIGMGKAKIAAIFNTERKSTQKGTANEEGFGIGMPLVKQLLKLHHTEVEIDSDRGAGCTVSFQLDLA